MMMMKKMMMRRMTFSKVPNKAPALARSLSLTLKHHPIKPRHLLARFLYLLNTAHTSNCTLGKKKGLASPPRFPPSPPFSTHSSLPPTSQTLSLSMCSSMSVCVSVSSVWLLLLLASVPLGILISSLSLSRACSLTLSLSLAFSLARALSLSRARSLSCSLTNQDHAERPVGDVTVFVRR